MDRDERKKYVLRWVNERRKEGGLKATSVLSKGERQAAYKCVITRSLSKVGVLLTAYDACGTVILTGRSRGRALSRDFRDVGVVRFLQDFDLGRYPELERA